MDLVDKKIRTKTISEFEELTQSWRLWSNQDCSIRFWNPPVMDDTAWQVVQATVDEILKNCTKPSHVGATVTGYYGEKRRFTLAMGTQLSLRDDVESDIRRPLLISTPPQSPNHASTDLVSNQHVNSMIAVRRFCVVLRDKLPSLKRVQFGWPSCKEVLEKTALSCEIAAGFAYFKDNSFSAACFFGSGTLAGLLSMVVKAPVSKIAPDIEQGSIARRRWDLEAKSYLKLLD